MSAQDRTLDQYHEWMQINAVSHLMRAAREVGVIDALRDGQRTAREMCESLSLLPRPTALMLDALVAIGLVEKYDEDYALARAGHLLCQYDADLGDSRWQRIVASLQAADPRRSHDDQAYFDHNAATQWIHTPAAIQAAEMLNIGGEGEIAGPAILDLGCGAGVWSCAMAHRDQAATVTMVDQPGALAAAHSTAASIGLLDRVTQIAGDPMCVDLPSAQFDIVLIAQRWQALNFAAATTLLARAVAAAKNGARIVVIDLFRGPTQPNLAEAVEALKLELDTQEGSLGPLADSDALFKSAGLERIQFSFLAASRVNLGVMLAFKPGS